MRKKKSVLMISMVGLGLVLFMTAYFGILRGKFVKNKSLSGHVSLQNSLLKLYENEVLLLNKMRGQVSLKNLNESSSQFGTELPLILGNLSLLAKRESLSLSQFELGQAAIFNGKFYQTPLRIKLVGTYADLATFLKKASSLAGVISLGDFKIAVENNRYDSSQRLNAEFTMNLYSISKETNKPMKKMTIDISGGGS